ncbi:hypothetical protein H5410_052642 [Solanum commersonii]|uniref:Uncharacterized protein n=1 Tax=Solanum commersonii TaxID=4109 RepID=A0A9J5X2R6_SOLCO|nr:hypothetical protein H5410_052642 [Solanum commersonii]
MGENESLLGNNNGGEVVLAEGKSEATQRKTTTTTSSRVVSLDVFRGLCVFCFQLMMLVDYGGSVFPSIAHSMEWCPLGRLCNAFLPLCCWSSPGNCKYDSFRQNWGNLESVIRTLKLFILGIFLQEMKLYLLKLQFCIISHNSPTSEVGVALVGSPIVLVPFTIDAKDSIALIPLLTEFQELNSKLENSKLKQELYRVIRVKLLAEEVDCLVGKLSESCGTWMGDVELRRRVPQKNKRRQRVTGLPHTHRHMSESHRQIRLVPSV